MKIIDAKVSEGRIYETWLLILPYLYHPRTHTINHHSDVGFRLTTIISCWAMIESFVRHALIDSVNRNYRELQLYDKLEKRKLQKANKNKLTGWVKNILRRKGEVSVKQENQARIAYVNEIQGASWGKLQNISKEIGLPINSIDNTSWEFLKYLYSLRNRFVHGVSFMVMKGTSTRDNDEISKEYEKALKYLSRKRIIDQTRLVNTRDINEVLNKKTTDYCIKMSCNCLHELGDLYVGTSPSLEIKKLIMQRF